MSDAQSLDEEAELASALAMSIGPDEDTPAAGSETAGEAIAVAVNVGDYICALACWRANLGLCYFVERSGAPDEHDPTWKDGHACTTVDALCR